MRAIAVWLAALSLAGCSGSDMDTQEKAAGGESPPPASEPAFETPQDVLDAALVCTPFMHPDKPPVLLVHGTFTTGYEQYDWTYLPLLVERGFDVCAVTYPDRGLGDQQVSAEYVANALRRIHAATHRKVAVIGHSQGATMPRWALKWWPSANRAVADFVLQAGPNHGTSTANARSGGGFGNPLGQPESTWQFRTDSNFMRVLNAGDETPGTIDYTSLYTQFDELVQPVETAMLDAGQGNPRVANILLQDVCPGRFVDHVTIGTTDRLSFELALDAILHDGPADVARAGGAGLCGLAPIVPDQLVHSSAVLAMLAILAKEEWEFEPHMTTSEPPLKPYAQ